MKGGSHTKSGVHYSGVCQLCEDAGIVARYDGESGRNGYWRCTMFHKKDIIENNESNAFAKHLQIFHQKESEIQQFLNSKLNQPILNHWKDKSQRELPSPIPLLIA